MLMIADSGSTKCDWRLLDNDLKVIGGYKTPGYNPYFHSAREIQESLQSHHDLMEYAARVNALHFYGAGASSQGRQEQIKTALNLVFREAVVSVSHDLLGAALATVRHEPAIICILGTGSNAAFYDGKMLADDGNALGYILGDEGSGCDLGKALLTHFLYQKLPPELSEQLIAQHELTREQILERVYKHPNPNVYLASFAPFLSRNKEHPVIRQLVQQRFTEFLDIHVCRFDQRPSVTVNFVGSIAHFFKDILQQVAIQKHLKIGAIVQQPVDGLVKYFQSKNQT